MAYLTTREEENKIILYRSAQDRWGSLLVAGMWSVAWLFIVPPSRWNTDAIKFNDWFWLFVFCIIPISWALALFATTIIIDNRSKLLRRTKSFLNLQYGETELSLTNLAKIRVVNNRNSRANQQTACQMFAVTRDGEEIKLNWDG